MRPLSVSLFLLLSFACGSVQSATVLGEMSGLSKGSRSGFWDTSTWQLLFGTTTGQQDNYDSPVFTEHLSASDIGKTFTYDSGEDFDAAVNILTNGIDERIVQIYGSSGTGRRESIVFDTGIGPDLIGYTITKIEFTLTTFDFTYDQSTNRTDHFWAGNVAFYGNANVVPIPAAAWLFGSALAGLCWIKRRQQIKAAG